MSRVVATVVRPGQFLFFDREATHGRKALITFQSEREAIDGKIVPCWKVQTMVGLSVVAECAGELSYWWCCERAAGWVRDDAGRCVAAP